MRRPKLRAPCRPRDGEGRYKGLLCGDGIRRIALEQEFAANSGGVRLRMRDSPSGRQVANASSVIATARALSPARASARASPSSRARRRWRMTALLARAAGPPHRLEPARHPAFASFTQPSRNSATVRNRVRAVLAREAGRARICSGAGARMAAAHQIENRRLRGAERARARHVRTGLRSSSACARRHRNRSTNVAERPG